MSLVSTNNITKKSLFLLSLVIFISLAVSLIRQIIVSTRINSKLAQKKETAARLEEKNQELQARLEEVKSPRFIEEEARKILGFKGEVLGNGAIGKTTFEDLRIKKTKEPVYQEWLRLFFY